MLGIQIISQQLSLRKHGLLIARSVLGKSKQKRGKRLEQCEVTVSEGDSSPWRGSIR